MSFPTFDLMAFENLQGAKRAQMASELDSICRKTGFLVVTGHGVSPDVIDNQWRAVKAFFAQDHHAKAQVAAPFKGYPYGWFPEQTEALAASKGEVTPPDLKESFNGGPLAVHEGLDDPDAYSFCYQPTLWPEIAGFQEAWRAYYVAMETLARRIMSAFAEALGQAPDFFDPAISHPISALRALRYPPTPPQAEDGQQRAGAHTDYGSLTILLPQKDRGGLQINRSGDWIDVPAPKDAFIINIGDLMAFWTADRWVSTLHRVVVRANQPERFSLAFFHQPNWDAEIMPMDGSQPDETVTSGRYLMNKFRSTSA